MTAKSMTPDEVTCSGALSLNHAGLTAKSSDSARALGKPAEAAVIEHPFVPSDPPSYPSVGAPKSLTAASNHTHDPARPKAANAAFTVSGRPAMPSTLGRPTELQIRVKQREFLRLLAAGVEPRDAAKTAGLKADTVLTLLERPEFRQAFVTLIATEAKAA